MSEEQVAPALARDPGSCWNRPRTMLDASKRGMGRHQRLPHNGSPISGETALEGFAEGTRIGAGRHEPPTPWRPKGRRHPWAAEAERPLPRFRPSAAACCTARIGTATERRRIEAGFLAQSFGESILGTSKSAAAVRGVALKAVEERAASSADESISARFRRRCSNANLGLRSSRIKVRPAGLRRRLQSSIESRRQQRRAFCLINTRRPAGRTTDRGSAASRC